MRFSALFATLTVISLAALMLFASRSSFSLISSSSSQSSTWQPSATLPPPSTSTAPTTAPTAALPTLALITTPSLPSVQSRLDSNPTTFPSYFRGERVTPPIENSSTSPLSELLKRHISQGILTISITNLGLLHQAKNLVENFRRSAPEAKLFFFCLDDQALKQLQEAGISSAKIPEAWVPSYLAEFLRSNTFEGRGNWGASNYQKMTHFKAAVMYQLLSQGFTVLFSDTDIILPRPGGLNYIAEIYKTHPDIIYQGSIDIPDIYLPPYANSGLYTCRPHPFLIDFFSVLMYNQQVRLTVDQFLFNEQMDILGIKEGGALNQYFFFWESSLAMNGKLFFIQKKYTQETLPYFAHADYLIGASKEEKIKEAGFWFV